MCTVSARFQELQTVQTPIFEQTANQVNSFTVKSIIEQDSNVVVVTIVQGHTRSRLCVLFDITSHRQFKTCHQQ